MKGVDVDELLRSERGRPGFSVEARESLWQGIASSAPGLSGPRVSSEKPSPAEEPTGETSLSQGPAGLPDGHDTASAIHHAGQIGSLKVGALLVAVALGAGALGAAAHARWAEPRIVVVERPGAPAAAPVDAASYPPPPAAMLAVDVPALTTAAAPAHASASARPSPVVASRAGAEQGAPSATSAARDPSLARERNLLDMARTALTRGDAAGALSALDTHAHDFPKSQLTEEREVLAIQALASANRLPEARRRAAAFRTSFPNSALLPIVDESTQSAR